MPPNSADIRLESITKDRLDGIEKTVDQLRLADLPPEKQSESLKLHEKMSSTINRMRGMLDGSNPETGLIAAAESLYADMERMRELLADRHAHAVQNVYGADSLSGVETAIDQSFERASATIDREHSPHGKIMQEMETIGALLAANPQDALTQSANVQSLYKLAGWQLVPDLRKIDSRKEFLESVVKNRSIASTHPEIIDHAKYLLQGLDAIRNVDPTKTKHYEWSKDRSRPFIKNWKGIRGIVAVIGGIVTAIGLSQTIRGKGFSPATAFWAILTAFAIKPDLLQSIGNAGVDGAGRYGSLVKIPCVGFRGPVAARAAEEIRELAPEERTTLGKLMKEKEGVTLTHIYEIFGRDSNMAKAVEAMPAGKRTAENISNTLRTLSRLTKDEDQEVIEKVFTGT